MLPAFILVIFRLPLLAQNTDEFIRLTNEWAKADGAKDTEKLAALYGDSVLFYGKNLDRNECIRLKEGFYKKCTQYNLKISDGISVDNPGGGRLKSRFVKKVNYNGKEKEYNAYLSFAMEAGKWLIVEESDQTTDANLLKMQEKKNNENKFSIKGDFRGDGKTEYGTIIGPEIDSDGTDCIGPCVTRIQFSDPTVPDIVINDCIDGHPKNLGDLNENGTDEIGMVKEWFTSCWAPYMVYTLINNKWEYAVPPFETYCDQWEKGVIPIEKDKKIKGNVIIRYSVSVNYVAKIKTKSVPVKK